MDLLAAGFVHSGMLCRVTLTGTVAAAPFVLLLLSREVLADLML